MKNLFTLFLILATASGFAQQQNIHTAPKTRVPKHLPLVPNFHNPVANHISGSSNARTSGACDTSDILDYNTYAELVAINAGLSYTGSLNGSSPQPYVQEATSSQITINSADNYLYSYVVAAFDTLVFPNYNTFSSTNSLPSSVYTKTLKTSTVTLDSVAVVMAISGDTVSADGTMTNDSLVFSIYSIANGLVNTTPVQTVSYVGYSGLAPFFTDGQHITVATIPVGYTFAQGQGFAIRADYYNADTSSHCVFAYGQADSCTDLVYQGQDLGFSFAYPSPFGGTADYANNVGNTFWGEIDSVSHDSAAVTPISNDFGYFNPAYGWPTNCSYVITQNWQFLPFVTVNNTLGITINGSNPLTLTCPSGAHTITTAKTGDLGGAYYNWSSNQTTGTISIFNPGTYTVTVTNSSGCTATDQLVASYAGNLYQTPTFTAPDSLCVGGPAGFVNTSTATGYTASWTYGEGVDSITQTADNVYTYTRAGSFAVTLTIDSAGCAFNTSQTVTVSSICVGIQNVTFDNNINIMPNPSNGNVTITVNGVDGNLNITVYNVIGQVVKSIEASDAASVFNTNLDLSNYSAGTYLVKIQSGSKIATKKLIITK